MKRYRSYGKRLPHAARRAHDLLHVARRACAVPFRGVANIHQSVGHAVHGEFVDAGISRDDRRVHERVVVSRQVVMRPAIARGRQRREGASPRRRKLERHIVRPVRGLHQRDVRRRSVDEREVVFHPVQSRGVFVGIHAIGDDDRARAPRLHLPAILARLPDVERVAGRSRARAHSRGAARTRGRGRSRASTRPSSGRPLAGATWGTSPRPRDSGSSVQARARRIGLRRAAVPRRTRRQTARAPARR